MRALRAENSRVEGRLDRLEQERARSALSAAPEAASGRRPPAGVQDAIGRPSAAREALPPLTVIKVKPKREPAPQLSTQVAVVEPPEGLLEALRAGAPSGLDESQAVTGDEQFDRGVEALKTGNPEGGITQLLQFVTDWPRHPKADNALYFAGLGMMALRDFEGAAKTFGQGVAQYPAGDVLLDSMLKLGECRLKLNLLGEARIAWQQILSSFPGTAAAAQAQARLASLPAATTASSP